MKTKQRITVAERLSEIEELAGDATGLMYGLSTPEIRSPPDESNPMHQVWHAAVWASMRASVALERFATLVRETPAYANAPVCAEHDRSAPNVGNVGNIANGNQTSADDEGTPAKRTAGSGLGALGGGECGPGGCDDG